MVPHLSILAARSEWRPQGGTSDGSALVHRDPGTRQSERSVGAPRSRRGGTVCLSERAKRQRWADYGLTMQVMPTLLLTGGPGSGKTAIAKEIGELLRRAGVRYAVVDLDALGEVGPPVDGGTFNSPLIAQNLAAMWPNYRAHGVDRLVLARVIGGAEEIAALRSAVPEADMRIGLILAPAGAVIERLRARETGVKRDFLVRIAPGLGDHLNRLGLEDFSVDNGAGRSVTSVALEVLDKLGWPVPFSPMSEEPQPAGT
jgi:hypothetical protein